MAGDYTIRHETAPDPSATEEEDFSSDEESSSSAQGHRLQHPSSSVSGTTPRSTPGMEPGLESQRFFFSLDPLTHPSLRAMPCSRFFFSSWQAGLHFDVDNRQGIIFNLSDQYLTSGAIGITCVALSQAGMYSAMGKVLAFIAGLPVEAGLRAAWSLTADMAKWQECVALVKFMAEASGGAPAVGQAGAH